MIIKENRLDIVIKTKKGKRLEIRGERGGFQITSKSEV